VSILDSNLKHVQKEIEIFEEYLSKHFNEFKFTSLKEKLKEYVENE
jgi:hypothetical protein